MPFGLSFSNGYMRPELRSQMYCHLFRVHSVNCQLWAVCFHWCILYGAKSAADICDTEDNTASHSASAKPSDQRRVTSAEFVEHLTHLMQKFPNGLPLSDLAAEYKVP